MTDADCVAFLQWALPRLGLRWAGYRKVRRQVCKRVARRMRALELPDSHAYRSYLQAVPGEWAVLDACCWISISRFFRDRGVFDALGRVVLPALVQRVRERGERRLRAWNAGCAAGEEAYTLRLLWAFAPDLVGRGIELDVLGTDTDERQLERAHRAVYPASSLREVPASWRARAFEPTPHGEQLREPFLTHVRFERQDLREQMPDGPFDLVLCRNVAFTYFEAPEQARVGARLVHRLAPGGALVIGAHERLPDAIEMGPGLGLLPWDTCPSTFRGPDPRR